MKAPDRRRVSDRLARGVITLGGLFIISSIIAMLVFIGGEAAPLLRPAKLIPGISLPAPTEVAARATDATDATDGPMPPIASVNEYLELNAIVTADGRAVVTGNDGARLFDESLPAFQGRLLTSACALDGGGESWIVGTSDGSLFEVTLEQGLEFTAAGRIYAPRIEVGEPIPLTAGVPILRVGAIPDGDGFVVAAWAGDDSVHVIRQAETTNLFGVTTREVRETLVLLPQGMRPTAITLEYGASHLFVATERGELLDYSLEASVAFVPTSRARTHAIFERDAITALGLLNGGHSLVIGSAAGAVEIWFRARTAESSAEPELIRAHVFEPHGAEVVGVSASQRDRSFVTWDRAGEVRLRYGTTEREMARLRPRANESPAVRVLFPRKGDALVEISADASMRRTGLHNPHPEVSLRALFGKVHYEGQPKPEYTWQSTGGSTDEFEPKLSLIPLIFGTFKGTAYALLFSVPIAILAATYTALFMHHRLRSVIKPAMELMAALPSVVLGFLAGLWFAPLLTNAMPIFLLMPFLLLAVILGFGWSWRLLPRTARARVWPGVEALVLAFVLALAIRGILALNGLANAPFEGSFVAWLYETFGLRYDQRNALVIGVAMGLAVIPIIFTISEDSISNVPRSLWAGSLALGATPWQTAVRVILPAASPGIFSAVMIGFGRAVGETMIVLMATGNTPILDWLPFNGLRSLAANIAVEIPEAPHGASLYRILFLTALVLFAITFAANTAAEIVRHRLRKRYSRF